MTIHYYIKYRYLHFYATVDTLVICGLRCLQQKGLHSPYDTWPLEIHKYDIILLIDKYYNTFLQVSLSFNYRLGRSTVCSIVRETCTVLWDVMAKEYVKAPSSVDEWKQISKDFRLKWNFPHCLGMFILRQ